MSRPPGKERGVLSLAPFRWSPEGGTGYLEKSSRGPLPALTNCQVIHARDSPSGSRIRPDETLIIDAQQERTPTRPLSLPHTPSAGSLFFSLSLSGDLSKSFTWQAHVDNGARPCYTDASILDAAQDTGVAARKL